MFPFTQLGTSSPPKQVTPTSQKSTQQNNTSSKSVFSGKNLDRVSLHARLFDGSSDEDSDDDNNSKHPKGIPNGGHYADHQEEESDGDLSSISSIDSDSEAGTPPFEAIMQTIQASSSSSSQSLNGGKTKDETSEDEDLDMILNSIEQGLDEVDDKVVKKGKKRGSPSKSKEPKKAKKEVGKKERKQHKKKAKEKKEGEKEVQKEAKKAPKPAAQPNIGSGEVVEKEVKPKRVKQTNSNEVASVSVSDQNTIKTLEKSSIAPTSTTAVTNPLPKRRSRIIKLKLPKKEAKIPPKDIVASAPSLPSRPLKSESPPSSETTPRTTDISTYIGGGMDLSALPSFKKNKNLNRESITRKSMSVSSVASPSVKSSTSAADKDRPRDKPRDSDRRKRSRSRSRDRDRSRNKHRGRSLESGRKSPPLVYRRPSNSPPPNRKETDRKGHSSTSSNARAPSPKPLFFSPAQTPKTLPSLDKSKRKRKDFPGLLTDEVISDKTLLDFAENIMKEDMITSRKMKHIESANPTVIAGKDKPGLDPYIFLSILVSYFRNLYVYAQVARHQADLVARNDHRNIPSDLAKTRGILLYIVAVFYNLIAYENVVHYAKNEKYVADTGRYLKELTVYVEKETWKKGWQGMAGLLLATRAIVNWNVDGFGIGAGLVSDNGGSSKRVFSRQDYREVLALKMVDFPSTRQLEKLPKSDLAKEHPSEYTKHGMGVGRIWSTMSSTIGDSSKVAEELLKEQDDKSERHNMKLIKHLVKTSEAASKVGSEMRDMNTCMYEYKEALMHIKSGFGKGLKTSVWSKEANLPIRNLTKKASRTLDIQPNASSIDLQDLSELVNLDFLMSLSDVAKMGTLVTLEFAKRLGLDNFFK